MAAYIGKAKVILEEDVFADATDKDDAEFKMLEGLKEDYVDAISVEILDIEEVK